IIAPAAAAMALNAIPARPISHPLLVCLAICQVGKSQESTPHLFILRKCRSVVTRAFRLWSHRLNASSFGAESLPLGGQSQGTTLFPAARDRFIECED